ncbi:MAG: immunoglobulin-like domain-containing protein [Candidatus Methylacidiphilales bacterium]
MKKTILLITTILGGLFANAQNPYPIIPLDSVQFTSASKLSSNPVVDTCDYLSPMKNLTYRDTVRFDGYVLFDPKKYGLSASSRKSTYLSMDTIAKPWGGVEVLCEPALVGGGANGAANLATLVSQSKFYDNLKPGMKVRVTAILRPAFFSGSIQYNTQTYVLKANQNWDNSIEILDFGPYNIKPAPVSIKELQTGNSNTGYSMQKATGEKWEGVYVELKDVTVLTRTTSNNRWTWSVSDDEGNGLEIRDYSGFYRNDNNSVDTLPINRFTPPSIGSRISYIRGTITEYNAGTPATGRYGICPLTPSDLGAVTFSPPLVSSIDRNPKIATSSDSVAITAKIQQITTASTSQVRLYYTTGVNSTTYDSISLVKNALPSDTSSWTGKIPKFADNTIVKFRVRPFDINNVSSLSIEYFYVVKNTGVTKISDLQYSVATNNSTIWNGDSLLNINVRGVVTGKGLGNLISIQDGTGPNSAIFISRNSGADSTAKLNIGDSILITRATVRENFNVTTLNNVLSSVISTGRTLPPFETGLSIDSFALGNIAYSRKWEGVLVKFDSLEIANVNPDAPGNFNEFSVNKSQNQLGLRVDDLSANFKNYSSLVYKGMKLNFIQGPMYFANANFKLIPRDKNDADFSNIDSIKPVITITGTNPINVKKDSVYADLGATATDDKDGNITSNIRTTGTVNTAVIGTYYISYAVNDKAGNMDSVTRTVKVVALDITKPVITITGKIQDTLMQGKSYVDAGATATDNIDGNITSKITKVSTLDSSKLATYTITYSVSDLANNTATAVRTVVVVKNTGVNNVNGISSSVKVYPSPAYAELNVSIENINQLPAQLVIVDMLGREVLKQIINTKNFNEQINISQLNNGVYFLNISNANGMQTVKFMVSGK